ncbi:MAG: hypothetical protein QF903_00620 [Planctomycetota bacterium]|jgi:hypothetical protein|nr:hypothetical protein [Planctomycetota bacterium]MDP6761891.1 hypothetical protein [Planctomycetota bacterium]MDP6987963.1 hypothetical protein [Planctomycetota bacterium]
MKPLRASSARAQGAGLTLVELVLATGLLTVLMIAVFSLLDGSLDLWRRAETRRNLSEHAGGLVELLATDLRSLEPGEQGDVLAEWVRFDADGDGLAETGWPRLRLVRQAAAAEVARLTAAEEEPSTLPGSLEVCWAFLPAGGSADARAEAIAWRGARLALDDTRRTFFDPGFFDAASGEPDAGELEDVTGGLLWVGLSFATQTSIVHDGWELGDRLEHAASSWDAWNRGRPDTSVHPYNEPGTGMPEVRERPLLPRRVRIEIELERETDRKARTRLTEHLAASDSTFSVDDPTRVPRGEDAFVNLDGEWMRVTGVSGSRVSVRRGQRGSEPVPHEPGSMVHWGARVVREVPITLYREDWNL